MPVNTQELIQSLIAGNSLTVDVLDQLISEKVTEDLHLEYKGARELDDKRKASATIRQYLSGFANRNGGVLIVGVDENSWTVEDCKAPGGGRLDDWAGKL